MGVPFGLRVRLERFFKARFPSSPVVTLTRLERCTEGFSQETWFVDVAEGAGEEVRTHELVVRVAPARGLLEPYDLSREFRVLQAMDGTLVPAPTARWMEEDPRLLGRPFYVMDRLPGACPIAVTSQDGRGPFDDDERAALGPAVARALAALHRVDWQGRGLALLGDPGVGVAPAAAQLDLWEARIRGTGLPLDPPLAEALLWLRGHLPEASGVSLLHGDYRLGNFLVATDGDGRPSLSGVLDWEMVHLGDPAEDLGWLTCSLWNCGTPLSCGLMTRDDLLAAYLEAGGLPVSPEGQRFYEVFSVVKMVGIMLCGVGAFRAGRVTDLRHAIFDHQLTFLYGLLGATRGWIDLED
jgi:aminoglycoside phosphotransferase (APT) family kinase protein